MSSSMYLEGQTTKKYGLPLTHLDFSYIEKCTNVKELEKILSLLRSGDEGTYPDLEKCTEKRLQHLDPKNRSLRKEGPILHPGDLSSGDWKCIEDDLTSWTNSMHGKDSGKPQSTGTEIIEGNENLPPVRSTSIVLGGKKQKKPAEKKKKSVVPRDYKDWDKIDVNAELNKTDLAEESKTKSRKPNLNGVSLDIDITGMSEEELELKAIREKDKGNEAFRSSDFEESVAYYTRSINLMPISASYNNRALAYLKLEKWNKAIKDCNYVLKMETDNIKALLRRGTAYKSKKDYKKANVDFEKVLKLEPNNKKAEDLLNEVKKEIKTEEKERKEKGGRRMIIEEVESDEGAEDIEKPVVNGYGPHGGVEEESNCPEPVCLVPSKASYTESLAQKSPVAQSQSESAGTQQSQAKGLQHSQNNASQGLSCSVLRNKDATVLCPDSSPSSTFIVTEDLQHTRNDASQELSHNTPTDKDTTLLFSDSPQLSDATVTDLSALPSVTKPNQVFLDQSSQQGTDSQLPKVSFTLEESSKQELSSQDDAGVFLDNTSSHPPLTRPVLVQQLISPAVQTLKDEGNTLFRSGQYGEAVELYTQAISQLVKESDQAVNMSVLLSNRAACHLKTGNCSEAVTDCDLSLHHVPHNLKALLRRAAAYETMERYGQAYVDYKHVISIDKSTDQAHQGATRCQNMLQQTYGPRTWRDKIPSLMLVQPWEVPIIVDQSGLHKSMSSTVSFADQGAPSEASNHITPVASAVPTSLPDVSSAPPTEDSALLSQEPPKQTQPSKGSTQSVSSVSTNPSQQETPVRQLSKKEEFENLKAEGNQYVQKGEYQEAAKCYSTCISLCPDQVACYTNRALCYLKLNMVSEAEVDCDKALSLQPTNPKALYRRALARKAIQQYKHSLQDFIELLKLEPKNTAAQKEIDIVKKMYKEELEMLKKATSEQETKVRKRVKIEEVDDEEEDEKPARGKAPDKVKLQGKRGSKSSQSSPNSKSKPGNLDKKLSKTHAASVQGLPVAPPIAPRLMKTTPYEFCQAWNSLKPCQGIQPYAEILRQVAPVDLPTVISNKLDGQMLQIIVRCVYEEMVLKGEIDLGYQVLDNLCKVPRFSTVSMFMTGKEKREVSGVLDILSKTTSSAYTSADIARLKKEYSVK